MALAEGHMLGPYKVEQQLGSGGMATIYRAYHARLDRHVAIKIMHQAFLQDTTFVARFEREAQIVARLEHPNIVPIFDFAEYENQPYLVMKYIEGRTLKAQIERADGLPLTEITRVLPLLADALDYAHRQGVLHRDIKPSNILFGKDGTPYLTDFGLARLAQLGESTLSSDMLLGTPHYISPEQAQGQRDLTPSTDLYSFGVVMYELLTGRVPFSADTPFAVIHDHIYRPLPLPSSLNPEITPQVEQVLLRALAKNPLDRFPTATALVQALMAALASDGLTTLNPARRIIASSTEARSREQSAPGGVPGILPDNQTVHMSTPLPTPLPAARPAYDPFSPIGQPGSEKPKRTEDGIRDPGRVEVSFDMAKVGGHIESIGERIEDWGERFSEQFDVGEEVDGDGRIVRFAGRDDELTDPDNPAALKRRARRLLSERNEFLGHLGAYIGVNLLLWIVYGVSDGSIFGTDGEMATFMENFPFPLIVMLGWGAGLLAHGIETYYDTGKRALRRIVAVHDEFARVYGTRWWQNANKNDLRKLRKKVDAPRTKRVELYQHIAVYVLINIMLWTIYGVNGDALEVGDFPWPLITMLGWGIGLFFHVVDTFGHRDNSRAIDRQVAAEQTMRYGTSVQGKRKNDDLSLNDLGVNDESVARPVRLTGDGELTDSMVQEIDPRTRRRDR